MKRQSGNIRHSLNACRGYASLPPTINSLRNNANAPSENGRAARFSDNAGRDSGWRYGNVRHAQSLFDIEMRRNQFLRSVYGM